MEEGAVASLEPSGETLVARVVQRDVAAFSVLYDRYAQPVYVLATYLLDRADAEEVVQDVFLRLWHSASQFTPERSRFQTWFMAIARHRVLDELRRRTQQLRWRRLEDIDRALAQAVDPATSLEEGVWQKKRDGIVLHTLQSLPDEQRRVLILAYFGGLSHTALAQHLGWPLGTVKKRLRLGLQKRRAALAQQGVESELPTPPLDEHGR